MRSGAHSTYNNNINSKFFPRKFSRIFNRYALNMISVNFKNIFIYCFNGAWVYSVN